MSEKKEKQGKAAAKQEAKKLRQEKKKAAAVPAKGAVHAKKHAQNAPETKAKEAAQDAKAAAAGPAKAPAAAGPAKAAQAKPKQKTKRTAEQKAVLKLKQKIRAKKHPVFRGRFGGRFKRRKSNEKWDKWRRPRGTDIIFKNEDGAHPKTGYRNSKAIRFLHPSGMQEVVVSNIRELSKVGEGQAARFFGKIGKRKRIEMIKKARELKIKVLNRWKK